MAYKSFLRVIRIDARHFQHQEPTCGHRLVDGHLVSEDMTTRETIPWYQRLSCMTDYRSRWDAQNRARVFSSTGCRPSVAISPSVGGACERSRCLRSMYCPLVFATALLTNGTTVDTLLRNHRSHSKVDNFGPARLIHPVVPIWQRSTGRRKCWAIKLDSRWHGQTVSN